MKDSKQAFRANAIYWTVGVVVLVLAVGTALLLARPGASDATELADEVDRDSPQKDDTTSQKVIVGGIPRPATDVQGSGEVLPANPRREVPVRQGFSEPVRGDANPQVANLAAALKSREKPSQYSSFSTPEPFDLDAYNRDPDLYLQTVEPGRVYLPAQPGADVPVIASVGKRFHRLRQGESVRLRVSAAVGAPVSFVSSRLGRFENELSSITVRAGDDGVAEATFTASGGTIDEIPILAASPMASGQVKFTLLVSVP